MANECSSLEELYKWCLNEHYKGNEHHPEHFANPDLDMSIIAKMELTCDLLGCVLGTFTKKNISVSLSECRYIIENQRWRHWTFALKEDLPVVSNIVPDCGKRWKKFPDVEKEKLKELFENFKSGVDLKVIQNELEKLESVQYYLDDLNHHKGAVYKVWKELPQFNIPGMEDRVRHHDDDKYGTIMVLGYTAEWCFKEQN